MKTLQNLEIKNVFFLIILVIVTFLTFKLFQPYINIIIFAIVIVQIFHPFYRYLYRVTKSKPIATFFSLITAVSLLIIPVVLIALLIFTEVRNLTVGSDFTGSLVNLENSINGLIVSINGSLQQFNIDLTIYPISINSFFTTAAAGVRDQLLPFAQQIVTLSGEILFTIFLLILCLIYFFPLYENLGEKFSKISPLDNKIDAVLFNKFRDTVKGVIKGTLFVAIVQATAVLIPLLFLNIPAPVLLWLIMVILSIIPVGSGLVWAPIGIGIIAEGVTSGNTGLAVVGILVIIYSAIIINVIDTTLRPLIMSDSVKIHPLVTIFSVLGGLYYFGFTGLLYGPLVVVTFISIMEVYHNKYLQSNKRVSTQDDEN